MILLALCCAAALFGILLIASATNYTGSLRYVIVQSIALVLGVALYAFFTFVDVEEASEKWKWIFAFNVVFILLLLSPLGVDPVQSGGNRAWLSIPVFHGHPAFGNCKSDFYHFTGQTTGLLSGT